MGRSDGVLALSSRSGAAAILITATVYFVAAKLGLSLAFVARQFDGHDLRVAGEATEALHPAEHFAPQVILSDLGLPGVDGYELAARLRARPAAAGAVLVALSGYGRAEDKRRAAEAGFDEHLIKPVDVDQLRRLLHRVGTTSA